MKTKSRPKSPSIRFRIDFSNDANIGPGKIELLEGIKTLGSLSAAARSLGISYRRGWLLLDSLNRSFDTPSAISTAGGRGGGKARVTEFGLLLIERYRLLESQISQVSAECLQEIARRVVRGGQAAPKLKRTALTKKIDPRR